MNRFITAVKNLDLGEVNNIIRVEPKWLKWSEPSGKNALHYLCGAPVGNDRGKAGASLAILKLLLKRGMEINSVQMVDDPNCDFPATPLWYAYAKGRNTAIYNYLLQHRAKPDNCWWAMAWFDDVESGDLWLRHGAKLEKPEMDRVFVDSIGWKRYRFAEWLLEHGADVNTPGANGTTALMMLIKRKDEAAIKMLLSYGADPDKRDDSGRSARSIAEIQGPRRIAALLENA